MDFAPVLVVLLNDYAVLLNDDHGLAHSAGVLEILRTDESDSAKGLQY